MSDSIRNCRFGYECSQEWSRLKKTHSDSIRWCDQCDEAVHCCETDEELGHAIRQGHCVAVRPSSEEPVRIGRWNPEPAEPDVPKDAYMGPLHREHFRHCLQEWLESVQGDTSLEPDRPSLLADRIEEAIGRLEKDEFGYCAECGEPIGLRRLSSRPVAHNCLECAEKKELIGSLFRDPADSTD